MGVFDDNKFEKLDWMTQITETIDCKLNDVLASLPETLDISLQQIDNIMFNSYDLTLDVSEIVDKLIKQKNISGQLSWDEQHMIYKCFEFDTTNEIILDFSVQPHQLIGKITLVKVTSTFEDQDLQKLLGKRGIESIHKSHYEADHLSRMNEIMEILGDVDNATLRNKSSKKKKTFIVKKLEEIFNKNEWRIRDMDLSNKVGYWIDSYIKSGNLASLTNFCKLKVMTHSNMPIYSIKEEV